ncbi:hypothetical protein MUK42_19616 [Musa troglodytarum]|uniref:Uncharacterized protein n=1 Tax=Musa troglodytarum TaxID=320322 RepID=A0A9E7FZN3_9LILI|nr:hypothetical protein MUK42_19616 [Musa troglodytarum]
MGWKLELGPGTLDFPVDFDDLRWQKKSITKGKGLCVEFDGRTHEHLKRGPPAALLTILQHIEKKEHKSGSKTYLEDPIPCRASNGHVLNYHQTGFDEECERFFSQIYKC